MQALDLDVATGFLLIAATLVELKARRLLPDTTDIDLDDEFALWEERDLLLARLLEAQDVQGRRPDLHQARRRRRPVVSPQWSAPTSDSPPSMPDMLEGHVRHQPAAMPRSGRSPRSRCRSSTCSTSTRSRSPWPTPSPSCSTNCPRAGRISFRRLTADLADRIEVIVRFLAVLELFKQGAVEIDQPERFGDIEVTWCARTTTSTPLPS